MSTAQVDFFFISTNVFRSTSNSEFLPSVRNNVPPPDQTALPQVIGRPTDGRSIADTARQMAGRSPRQPRRTEQAPHQRRRQRANQTLTPAPTNHRITINTDSSTCDRVNKSQHTGDGGASRSVHRPVDRQKSTGQLPPPSQLNARRTDQNSKTEARHESGR